MKLSVCAMGLVLAVGCAGPRGEQGNQGDPGPEGDPGPSSPVLNSLTAEPPVVLPGGTAVLTAWATDAGGDALSFSWAAGCGTLDATGANPVTFTAPATTGTCLVTVDVTDTEGLVAHGALAVLVAVGQSGPVITSVVPDEAKEGQEIRVAGLGFGASQAGGTLTISGLSASISAWSDTEIRALVPAGAVRGDVLVVAWGTASNAAHLDVLWPVESPENLPVCTDVAGQYDPVAVSDGEGGAIIAWYDYRSEVDYDIYAQRMSPSGLQ